MAAGWVYFMTNRPNGILYTGVTNDIFRRTWEHREGLVAGFTKRYELKRLVFVELADNGIGNRHQFRPAYFSGCKITVMMLSDIPHPDYP